MKRLHYIHKSIHPTEEYIEAVSEQLSSIDRAQLEILIKSYAERMGITDIFC